MKFRVGDILKVVKPSVILPIGTIVAVAVVVEKGHDYHGQCRGVIVKTGESVDYPCVWDEDRFELIGSSLTKRRRYKRP